MKQIFNNTLSNYLLKALQITLNLIAIPILIQNMGSEGFGIILFAGVLVGYFSILEMGVAQAVTKYIAEYTAKQEHIKLCGILNTSIFFYGLLGFVVCIGTAVFVVFDGLDFFEISEANGAAAKNIFLLAGFIALFSWPKIAIEAAFRGLQKFPILNFTVATGRIISVILALVLASLEARIEYVFLAFNADRLLLLFWQYWLLKREIDFWQYTTNSVSFDVFKKIFSFSGWIMLGQVAVILEYQSDQFILASMDTVSAIATYTVIFFLFRLIQQVSGLAASAVMPAIAEMKANNNIDSLEKYVFYGASYHNMLFVPVIIVGYFISEPFLRLWVGEDYLGYLWLVKLSVLFQLIWQSNAFLGQVYTGIGKAKKAGLIAIFCGLLNVTLSVVLVDYYGLPGVILGTLSAGLVSVPLFYIYVIPDFGISRRKCFKKIFLRTQTPLLLTGMALYPLSDYFNQINSWPMLLCSSLIVASYLYLSGFLFVVNPEHKRKIYGYVSSRLSILEDR